MTTQRNNAQTHEERMTEPDSFPGNQNLRATPDPYQPVASSTPSIFPGDIAKRDPLPLLPSSSRNRRSSRRKVSPFNIMLMLLGGAVAIVLYVGNIIAVNELMGEINSLQAQHQRIIMEQEILRAQLNRMASLERIQEIAEKELGLRSLREPPQWLPIDQEKVKEAEEASRKRHNQ